MNKIEKIAQNIVDHLPMDAKKIVLGSTVLVSLMAGCGRVVDTNQPTTPAPTTTIEYQVDDPVVDVPVVEDETVKPGETSDVTVTPAEESNLPEPTFVQTGENAYTVYVDCPDNSNAPELDILPANDTVGYIPGSASLSGLSENLINAVMTHGMQVDPSNAAQINFDAYMDIEFEHPLPYSDTFVLTNNPSLYGKGVETYTIEDLKYDDVNFISHQNYTLCSFLLRDAIFSTNGNITCALMRYNMGPEAWNQVMEECMNATGLTAEQIYTNYDASYVLSFDAQGLGNPNYVNDVLQYIGNEPITVTSIDANGSYGDSVTYTIDRAKTYGQR